MSKALGDPHKTQVTASDPIKAAPLTDFTLTPRASSVSSSKNKADKGSKKSEESSIKQDAKRRGFFRRRPQGVPEPHREDLSPATRPTTPRERDDFPHNKTRPISRLGSGVKNAFLWWARLPSVMKDFYGPPSDIGMAEYRLNLWRDVVKPLVDKVISDD